VFGPLILEYLLSEMRREEGRGSRERRKERWQSIDVNFVSE
jgi:hypothetical protein